MLLETGTLKLLQKQQTGTLKLLQKQQFDC